MLGRPGWIQPREVSCSFCSALVMSWAAWTLRTRAVLQPATATTWTLCCSIEMSRDQRVSVAAGTELIIGQNCFITPDFCWKMAKICMVATSQMPGSIIKLSQYYHIPSYQHHTARKNAKISRPSHCYGRTFTWWLAVLKFIFSSSVMWMWSSELVRLRGPDNKSNMKFAMNPNVPTKLDCALSWAVVWEAQSCVSQSLHYNHWHCCCSTIITTIHFILTVRWKTPEICMCAVWCV